MNKNNSTILLRLSFYLFGATLGVYLAIAFTFFTDIEYISRHKWHFLKQVTDEWRLLSVLLTFTFTIYCAFMGNFEFKKLKQPKIDWWESGIIYQLYPRSFKDTNSDGIGDIRGMIEKLDYLKELGIDIIYLNPIYKSSGKDNGYDIVSFFEFDSEYGTMNDFEEFMKELHKREMYLIMDFVPNHTSDQHEWFIKSCEGDEKYKDYYIWYESEDKENPPTNWITTFCKPAWTYHEKRKAWYYHTFLPNQPDLNLRSERVRKELENIIDYWLKFRDVDGLRIDAVKHFYESQTLKDEPMRPEMVDKPFEFESLNHIYTIKQPENYALLSDWREQVDQISKELKKTKVLFGESYEDPDSLSLYFNYNNRAGMHFPCNFQLLGLKELQESNKKNPEVDPKPGFNPLFIKKLIDAWFKNKDTKNFHSNWSLGNHDVSRVATRVGRENSDLANALNLLLGGTPFTYYGEELGMSDLPKELIKFETCQDEFAKSTGLENYQSWNRDYWRSPMQWDDSPNAGFTQQSIQTWLPVHPNYETLNVKAQINDPFSSLRVYKNLARIRKNSAFQWGTMEYAIVDENVFSFLRKAFDNPTYLVAINCSKNETKIDLSQVKKIPTRVQVEYYFYNNQKSIKIDLQQSQMINTKKSCLMDPKSCLILKWSDSF